MRSHSIAEQGFTLIELLVVMLIVASTLVVGVPSIIDAMNEQRLTAASNDMISALNLARSESIKLQQTVTVRKVSDWEDGWTVFIDADSDGDLDVGEVTIVTYPSIDYLNATVSAANFTNYISYNPNGRANTLGNFTFCPPSNVDSSRKISIAGSGRMRTERGAYCPNCAVCP